MDPSKHAASSCVWKDHRAANFSELVDNRPEDSAGRHEDTAIHQPTFEELIHLDFARMSILRTLRRCGSHVLDGGKYENLQSGDDISAADQGEQESFARAEA